METGPRQTRQTHTDTNDQNHMRDSAPVYELTFLIFRNYGRKAVVIAAGSYQTPHFSLDQCDGCLTLACEQVARWVFVPSRAKRDYSDVRRIAKHYSELESLLVEREKARNQSRIDSLLQQSLDLAAGKYKPANLLAGRIRWILKDAQRTHEREVPYEMDVVDSLSSPDQPLSATDNQPCITSLLASERQGFMSRAVDAMLEGFAMNDKIDDTHVVALRNWLEFQQAVDEGTASTPMPTAIQTGFNHAVKAIRKEQEVGSLPIPEEARKELQYLYPDDFTATSSTPPAFSSDELTELFVGLFAEVDQATADTLDETRVAFVNEVSDTTVSSPSDKMRTKYSVNDYYRFERTRTAPRPEEAEFVYDCATNSYQEGEYDQAASDYLKAFELDGTWYEALQNYGLSMQFAGKLRKALTAYISVYKHDPGPFKWMAAASIPDIGLAWHRKGIGRGCPPFRAVERECSIVLDPDHPALSMAIQFAQIALGAKITPMRVATLIRLYLEAGSDVLAEQTFDQVMKASDEGMRRKTVQTIFQMERSLGTWLCNLYARRKGEGK